MRLLNTIEIGNVPEKVFYWLEDPSRAMQWMTSVSRTEIIKKTPGLVGTRFREFVEEDGRGTEMRGVVTDFISNKRLAFHLEGDFNSVEVSFSLRKKGEMTQLSQNADIKFKKLWRLFSFLFGPIFKRKLIIQTQNELAKLKELCERDDQY